MNIDINFAQPVQIYDNFLNRCAGKFCHVEASVKIDIGQFRVLIDSNIQNAYSPSTCQNILNNTKDMKGEKTIAFYILFGGIMSIRFLDDENEDPFFKSIDPAIYDVISLPVSEEKFYDVVVWNIKHLGRSYDIPKALCSVTPFFPFENNNVEKFFCSQLIMHMIKDNGIIQVKKEINIDHMKPDAVYEFLMSSVEYNEDDI